MQIDFKLLRKKIVCLTLVIAVVVLRIVLGMVEVRHPIDAVAIIAILIAGIGMSAAIAIADSRGLGLIGVTTVRAVLGAALGFILLSDYILRSHYGYDHGFGETSKSTLIAGSIGIVLNCGFWSIFTQFRMNLKKGQPPQD